IYPWPVNMLHYLVLRPNTRYTPTRPVGAANLPYTLPPRAVQTLGSPVRLFAQSAVALGPWGTAMWFDSHADEWAGPSDAGQRLAGEALDARAAIRAGAGAGAGEPWGVTTSSAASAASMVFASRNDDGWTRIAMDEEAGRVALGCADGNIVLYDYA
ncbi:hypothetical protein CONPUDRAFT_43295, partial [Coniophora puteana RWD-64-598 SS2]